MTVFTLRFRYTRGEIEYEIGWFWIAVFIGFLWWIW
jgi:hypothetical protein